MIGQIDEIPAPLRRRIGNVVAHRLNQLWGEPVVTRDEVLEIARTGTLDGKESVAKKAVQLLADEHGVVVG